MRIARQQPYRKPVIYTIGYAGRQTAEVIGRCVAFQAVLVDIRYSPRSRNPAWNKRRLFQALGKQYMHLPALGNENYRGGPIKLHDPEAAVPIISEILMEQPVMLLCVCRDWRTCHRRDAAEYLAKAIGASVEHLE